MGVASTILLTVNAIVAALGFIILCVGVFARYGSASFKDEAKDVLDAIPTLPDKFGIMDSRATSQNLELEMDEYLHDVAVALVVIGGFVMLIGVFGCFGICCKSKALLIVYTVIIILLIIVQIILLGLFFSGTLNSQIKGVLKDTLSDDFIAIDSYDKYSVSWNYFMLNFKCCGVDSYKDFVGISKWDNTRRIKNNNGTRDVTLAVPFACCKVTGRFPDVTPVDENCAVSPSETNSNYQSSCFDSVKEDLSDYEPYAVGACAAAVILQILMAMTAILVLYSLSERDNYYV